MLVWHTYLPIVLPTKKMYVEAVNCMLDCIVVWPTYFPILPPNMQFVPVGSSYLVSRSLLFWWARGFFPWSH